MKMKRMLTLLMAMTMALSVLAGCSSSSDSTSSSTSTSSSSTESSTAADAGYEEVSLKLTCNGTDIATDTTVANEFVANVSDATGGNVSITVFPNDQLAGGNQSKGIEMLAQGTTDLAAYSNGVLANLNANIQIANLPFIFDNYEEAAAAFAGAGGEYIAGLLDEKGVLYMGAFHNGLRQLSNSKREVVTPEDVAGLKIRIPGGDAYVETFKALGADPVAMSWSEVFTALQQGTLDGQENGFATSYSNNMHEVQPYVTEWNYMYDAFNMVANKANFEKLDAATQELIIAEAAAACAFGNELVESSEAEIKEFYAEAGVTVTTLTAEQLQAFKDIVEPVQQTLAAAYGEEACAAFGLN